MQKCKKCLLLEAGESVTYNEIMQYISTLNSETLCNENTYKQRLAECRACDNLISGMCLKCGCYVEVRARLREAECPDYDNKRW